MGGGEESCSSVSGAVSGAGLSRSESFITIHGHRLKEPPSLACN